MTLVLAKIGERSYSIYLWHMPFSVPLVLKLQTRLGLWTSPLHTAMMTGVYVAVAIGIGSMMFALIEAPAVALRERWFPSRSNIEVTRSEASNLHAIPRPSIKLPPSETADHLLKVI